MKLLLCANNVIIIPEVTLPVYAVLPQSRQPGSHWNKCWVQPIFPEVLRQRTRRILIGRRGKGENDCERCHRQSHHTLLTQSLCHRTWQVMCTSSNRQCAINKETVYKECNLCFLLCQMHIFNSLTAGCREWGHNERRLFTPMQWQQSLGTNFHKTFCCGYS